MVYLFSYLSQLLSIHLLHYCFQLQQLLLSQCKPPPAGWSLALQGLWWDGHGDWARAHGCAQDQDDIAGAMVHAYLHRKEGDQGNTAYCYGRAEKPVCREPLDREWLSIVRDLLRQSALPPACNLQPR